MGRSRTYLYREDPSLTSKTTRGKRQTDQRVARAEDLLGTDAGVLSDRNFQLVLLVTVFPVLGTGLVSPILDSLIEPLGTTPERIGLLIAAFSAPAIVLIPVVGALADHYGRRPIMVISLLCFGGGGVAIAATTDFGLVIVLRFLQGVGFAGMLPLITTSIGDRFTGGAEATAQGLRSTVTGASAAIFPLLAGALVAVSWAAPFLLYALAIPTALFVFRWYEEPLVDARTGDGDLGRYAGAVVRLLRRGDIASVLIARTLPTMIWIAFLTYNSLIVVRIVDGTPQDAGVLVALTSLVFAAVSSQVGRLSAGLQRPVGLPLVGHLGLGLGLCAVLFAPTIAVAAAGAVTIGAGMGVTLPVYRNVITGLAPASRRAGLVGVSEAYSQVGATVTPLVMGGLIAVLSPHFGTNAALQVAGTAVAVVGTVGGAVCLLAAGYFADAASPMATAE